MFERVVAVIGGVCVVWALVWGVRQMTDECTVIDMDIQNKTRAVAAFELCYNDPGHCVITPKDVDKYLFNKAFLNRVQSCGDARIESHMWHNKSLPPATETNPESAPELETLGELSVGSGG